MRGPNNGPEGLVIMQVGHKAQGHEGTQAKKIAEGLGHTSGKAKWRVRRSLERRVRQAGRQACQEKL